MGNKKKGYNREGAKEKRAEELLSSALSLGEEVGDDSGTVRTHTRRQVNTAYTLYVQINTSSSKHTLLHEC